MVEEVVEEEEEEGVSFFLAWTLRLAFNATTRSNERKRVPLPRPLENTSQGLNCARTTDT